MKAAVIYYSKHHGNTKKLLDALTERFDVTLLSATEAPNVNLDDYEVIGFASGIYYSKFHKSVLNYAEKYLPNGKNVFFVYTCGAEKKGYTAAIAKVVKEKSAKILGEYGCLGFDSFGPFKLIGGIAKGHPDSTDIEKALAFAENILG